MHKCNSSSTYYGLVLCIVRHSSSLKVGIQRQGRIEQQRNKVYMNGAHRTQVDKQGEEAMHVWCVPEQGQVSLLEYVVFKSTLKH